MIGAFVAGLFVGAFLGVVVMAVASMANTGKGERL